MLRDKISRQMLKHLAAFRRRFAAHIRPERAKESSQRFQSLGNYFSKFQKFSKDLLTNFVY